MNYNMFIASQLSEIGIEAATGEGPSRSKAKRGIVAERKSLDAWLAKNAPTHVRLLTSKNKAKRKATTPTPK